MGRYVVEMPIVGRVRVVVALADVLGLSMDDVAAQLLEKTRSRNARGVLLGSGDSR